LTARFAEASQAALAVPQSAKSQQPVEAKVFAPVAEKTQQKIAGLSMTVYPALVEEGGTVKEGRFSTQAEAEYPASPRLAAVVAAATGRACEVSAQQVAGADRTGPALP
jgi:hypothetical protein